MEIKKSKEKQILNSVHLTILKQVSQLNSMYIFILKGIISDCHCQYCMFNII